MMLLPKQKSKGYTAKDGETALMVEMASRPYGPKNIADKGLLNGKSDFSLPRGVATGV